MSIKIRKYANNYTNPEIVELPFGYSLYKSTRYKNESLDTTELVFRSADKEAYKRFDRVALEEDYYNWYILSTNVKLKDMQNEIYEHSYTLIELAQKLKNFPVSTLSYNNLVYDASVSGRINLYNNLYEVVCRLNRLTPFELESNLIATRVITSYMSGGVCYPYMTSSLKTLLQEYTDVPEFNFTGRNLFEALTTIFSLVGGSPKLIEKLSGDANNVVASSLLDINLFDEDVGEVDISEYDYYEEVASGENYAIDGEVNANNIIDINSKFVQGLTIGNYLQSDELLLDDDLLIFGLKKAPIERLMKAKIYQIGDISTVKDATDFIKSDSEYKLLDIGRGSSTEQTVQNCLTYSLGGSEIKGFGNKAKKGIILFDSLVFSNLLTDLGFTSITDLKDYAMIIEYIPFLNNNRMKAKAYNLTNMNKQSTININNGDRVNEMSKVLRDAQNKISRISQRQVIKGVTHAYIDDVYALGTLDTDTGLKIAVSDVEVTVNNVHANYILIDDLNLITDYVNVNTENRFTDVQATFNRNEIYEDWCLISTDESLIGLDGLKNTSSINSDKIDMFFPISSMDSQHKYWLLPNKEAGDSIIVPPIVSAGANAIIWKLPFDTPRFIGNEITDITVQSVAREMERGVPYTNALGQLEKSSFIYGVDLIENIDPSASDLKSYPYSLNFLDTLGVGEERDYIFSIGTASITKTTTPVTVSDYSDSVFIEGTALGSGLSTYNYDTKTQTLTTAKVSNITMNMTINPFSDKLYQEIDKDESITIDVSVLTKYGVYITVKSQTFKPTQSYIIVSDRDYQQIIYYDDFLSGDRDFIDVADFESRAVKDYSFDINVSSEISEIIIEISGRYKKSALLQDKTKYVYLKDIVYNLESETSTDDDGLLIDKNPNEILSLQYQVNYAGLSSDVIVGDKLTDNSRFIYDEDNQNKYIRFDLYASTTTKINKYNFTKIIGSLISTIPIYSLALAESIALVVNKDSDLTLYDTFVSWSYVGVRLDSDSNEVADFLFGVNKVDGTLQNIVEVVFKHFHPQIVYSY